MLRHVFLTLLVVALVFPRDVYAYLDPGTGSLAIQAVVAAIAAAAYAARAYWSRARALFKGRRLSPPAESADAPR